MKTFGAHHVVVLLSAIAIAVATLDDGRMLLRSPGHRALANPASVENIENKAVAQGEDEGVGQGQDMAVGQGEGEAVGQIEKQAVGQGQGNAVGHGEAEDVGERKDKAVVQRKTIGKTTAPDKNPAMARRFNKFKMYYDYSGPAIILASQDYPLSEEMSYTLRYYSSGYSIVTKGDFELKGRDIEKYIAVVGGYTTMQSNDPTSEFWKDVQVITEAQIKRRQGLLPDPRVFTLPELWKNFTAHEVAEAVHDEVMIG